MTLAGKLRIAYTLVDHLSFELPTFGDILYLLAPISHGWAILGRSDKFLGPCVISRQKIEPDRVILDLIESGPVLLWITDGEPHVEGGLHSVTQVGSGLWRVNLPKTHDPVQLALIRHASA